MYPPRSFSSFFFFCYACFVWFIGGILFGSSAAADATTKVSPAAAAAAAAATAAVMGQGRDRRHQMMRRNARVEANFEGGAVGAQVGERGGETMGVGVEDEITAKSTAAESATEATEAAKANPDSAAAKAQATVHNQVSSLSSFEQLQQRLHRAMAYLWTWSKSVWDFVVPKFTPHPHPHHDAESTSSSSSSSSFSNSNYSLIPYHFFSMPNSSVVDFLLRHLDTNQDGSLSSAELLNVTEVLLHQYHSFFDNSTLLHHRHPSYPYDSYYYPQHPKQFLSSAFQWLRTMGVWFSREWPLLDWKLGVFVWRVCGSATVLVLALLSMVPGRAHTYSAQILRWPILGLTYFLVVIELSVYILIRLVIRLVEHVVARPKHRMYRAHMRAATCYEEWRHYATLLDQSQKRDVYYYNNNNKQQQQDDHSSNNHNEDSPPPPSYDDKQRSPHELPAESILLVPEEDADATANTTTTAPYPSSSSSYNWNLIVELMKDLVVARNAHDALFALAVVRQCLRKNVGGVLNEDAFCGSNAGEPRTLVREFYRATVHTLQWLTDDAAALLLDRRETTSSSMSSSIDDNDSEVNIMHDHDLEDDNHHHKYYHGQLRQNVRGEEDKLWKLMVDMSSSSSSTTATAATHSVIHNKNTSNGVATKADTTEKSSVRVGSRLGNGRDNGSSNNRAEETPPSTPTRNNHHHNLPRFHHREQVLSFLKGARATYGRTALCLSGGAMMGLYHFGVVKALHAQGLLPHIISGTSAGSVVGAIVCTRTDEELVHDLQPEVLIEKLVCFSRPWKDRIFNGILKDGNMFLEEDWIQLIRWFTRGDMTFLEAYRRTGKIFCITLSSTSKRSPPVLLNYVSAPNVVIASAVIASAAVPGFINPVRLRVKEENGVIHFQGGSGKDETFWDGSIQADLPTKGLSDMLNCQFFIASQCNPHIAPFFFNPKGGVGMPSRWTTVTKDGDVAWRGGFLLAALEMYLKTDMKAKMCFLNDVEAAVGFTSTMMIQDFVGTTTIVPHLAFGDYFKLFTNPSLADLKHCFQAGTVAAYGHFPMISLHNSIVDALDQCIAKLESCNRLSELKRHRASPSSSADAGSGFVAKLLQKNKILRDLGSMQAFDHNNEDEDDEYEQF